MTMTTERRNEMIEQLAAVREERRIEEPWYYEHAPIIKARRLEKENLRGRIRNADERIGAHYDSRSRAVDYLPEDPECVEWSKELERLEAEKQALVDQSRAINPEEYTQRAIEYEGPNGKIAHWQMTENNLVAALERDADEHRNLFERGEISAVR